MTYSIVDGILKRNGQPFIPDDRYRGISFKGWDGSEIVYFRIPSLGSVRRITKNGESWWAPGVPQNSSGFIGPAEVRAMISKQRKEREAAKLLEGRPS